ncbi:MAG: ABC transporter substrate-binding protein [Gemmatimonadota bacterium]
MNTTMKTTSLVTTTAMILLAGCRDRPQDDAGAGSERPDTGGTAVVALAQDIDFANGLLSGETYSQAINRLLFLPLVRYDERLEIQPLLAVDWQFEADTAVVFRLRNDVHWQDGVKTSAHDVEFTYRYGKDPRTGYPNGDYWIGWNDAEVLDSFTIRFSITPQPEPLANLAWIPIMPSHLLERIAPHNLRNAEFNQKPIGNGPLRFVEYRPNDRWIFEANRDYPAALGGRPYLDRVVFRVIPEETAQEAELIAGNIDLATRVRAERFEPLDALPDVRAIDVPGRQYGFIGWNTRRPPLDDARVRRALTMAIDREKLIEVLRGGRGEVAVGPVPSYHWSFDENIRPLPYSVDSARTLLADAGIQDTNGDGMRELRTGRPFEIELKTPANNPFNRDMAELIRSDLALVGVKVVTRPTEFGTMIEEVTSPERKFQAVLMGWQTDFRLVVYDNFHSSSIDNPFQFASYRNAEVDTLLDKLQTTTSRAAARPLWQRLQTIIRDEQPWTFLYSYSTLYAARERLKGLDMDMRGPFVNLTEWWVADGGSSEGRAPGQAPER